MSKYELIRSLKHEIKKINYIIDQKIVQGASYAAESRRHRMLVSQLHHIQPPRTSWLSRSVSFAAMFML